MLNAERSTSPEGSQIPPAIPRSTPASVHPTGVHASKECVDRDHGVAATEQNLFGILSLVFWSLTMVVTVKYLTFIMRADNRGEGGILALLALASSRPRAVASTTRIGWLAGLVIFGAALLYGDGVITPA